MSSSSGTRLTDNIWFQLFIVPLGAIPVFVLLGLLFPPLGKWLVNVPWISPVFGQLCRVTDAACNPATLLRNPEASQKTRFVCAKNVESIPTTYAVVPDKGNVPLFSWVSDYFSTAGYDPQTRCNLVTERFQSLYNQDLLNYITIGYMNGETVVCIALDKGQPCIQNGLLLTLKPTDDPNSALKHILESGSDVSEAYSYYYVYNDSPYVDSDETGEEKVDRQQLYVDINSLIDTIPAESSSVSE